MQNSVACLAHLKVQSRLLVDNAFLWKQGKHIGIGVMASSTVLFGGLLLPTTKCFEVIFDTHDGVIHIQSLTCEGLQLRVLASMSAPTWHSQIYSSGGIP